MDGLGQNLPPTAPCVLLHGFAQHSDSWDAVAGLLRAQGIEAFAPKLAELSRTAALARQLGGRSDAGFESRLVALARSDEALAAVCADVAELVERAADRAGAPAVLAGYSMGGRIALEAVCRHGRMPLRAVVLESAGLGPQDGFEREQLRQRNAEWSQRVFDQGVSGFMDWWQTLPLFATQQHLPKSTRARLRRGRLNNEPEGLAFQLLGWGAHHQHCRADALAALRRAAVEQGADVRYVVGSLDAKYSALACKLRDQAPEVRVDVVEGAGHNVHLEQPDAVARLVASSAREP